MPMSSKIEDKGVVQGHVQDMSRTFPTKSKSLFDFENRTQSEARELPTSGHKSVMEGPTMVLIVSIAL